jgi:D-glycero-D-manno-heptose 1,7-bisphosphate phosphatase
VSAHATARPAVFLDRDGTMIEDVGYLDHLNRVSFFPWTVDAVRALNRAGFALVVVTNQSGVARGFFSESFVDATHRHMSERLRDGGARIDAYYYCPHHPGGSVAPYVRDCDCRKPAAGLVERASRELRLDPARSFVVGDRQGDIELARAVGAKGVLVRTRPETDPEMHEMVAPDAIVDNLAAAASWILTHR